MKINPEDLEEQRHPWVAVKINDEAVPIDEDLAPLIAALQTAGFQTVTCCQGDPGERARIEFADPGDAAGFLAIAGQEFNTDYESLWNRAFRYDEPEDDWERFRAERLWECSASPRDWSVVRDSAGKLARVEDAAAVDFTITVMFPRDDIPALTALVEADE
jgi:hypothetical protein